MIIFYRPIFSQRRRDDDRSGFVAVLLLSFFFSFGKGGEIARMKNESGGSKLKRTVPEPKRVDLCRKELFERRLRAREKLRNENFFRGNAWR